MGTNPIVSRAVRAQGYRDRERQELERANGICHLAEFLSGFLFYWSQRGTSAEKQGQKEDLGSKCNDVGGCVPHPHLTRSVIGELAARDAEDGSCELVSFS